MTARAAAEGPPAAGLAQRATIVVAGAQFSGATTLAWALGQHPQLQPVVGAERSGDLLSAMTVIDEDVVPLLARAAGTAPPLRPAADEGSPGWVISGAAITQRLELTLGLFPELRLLPRPRGGGEAIAPPFGAPRRPGGRPPPPRG